MASETETTRTEYPHIVRTPGVLGGQARIADHRIRVRDVVAAHNLIECVRMFIQSVFIINRNTMAEHDGIGDLHHGCFEVQG